MNKISSCRMLVLSIVVALLANFALYAVPVKRDAALQAAMHELPGFFAGSWLWADEETLYDLSGGTVAYMFMFRKSQAQVKVNDVLLPLEPVAFVASKRMVLSKQGVSVSGNESDLYGQDVFASIVISAVDTEPVVLRCFRGLPSHVVKSADAMGLATETAPGSTWRVRHYLMLGLFDEAFSLETANGESELIVDMRTQSVTTPAKAKAKASVKKQVAPDAERVSLCQKAWKKYLGGQGVSVLKATVESPSTSLADVISENYIPGATNAISSVPTYLNSPTMYYPVASGGICWATATTDILAYYDRNAYGGVKYWNLIDNGTPPLLQPALPTMPGHDEADVKTAISFLAHQYYTLGNTAEKALIEEFANTTNGLGFVVAYHGAVSTTVGRTIYLGTIKSEIDAGRPISLGSYGTVFGGPHQIPVIGYKETSNTVNSTVYIHLNTGGTQSEYDSLYSSLWGGLDMDQIVPGGTPVDAYEGMGDDSVATSATLAPDAVYGFRQTHNFDVSGDEDWVQLSAESGRAYTIKTASLGASCDTVLTLFESDGATQIAQNDDGGDEARASKIVWDCWATGTYYMQLADGASGSGHAAHYDLEVSYGTALKAPPADISLSDTNVVIEWASSVGWYYMCECTENLVDDPITWTLMGTGWVRAVGTTMSEADTNTMSHVKRFYRIKAKL